MNNVIILIPETSLRLSKSSAIRYFLYFIINCNAKKIETINMSIKSKAVAKCAGFQKIHSSSTFVKFVSKGTVVVVLFLFKYFLSIKTRCCN